MGKQMPRLGPAYYGRESAIMQISLEAAEKKYAGDYTPFELGEFRTGYHTGRVERATRLMHSMIRDLNRAEIIDMADALESLIVTWEREIFGVEMVMPGLKFPERKATPTPPPAATPPSTP